MSAIPTCESLKHQVALNDAVTATCVLVHAQLYADLQPVSYRALVPLSKLCLMPNLFLACASSGRQLCIQLTNNLK